MFSFSNVKVAIRTSTLTVAKEPTKLEGVHHDEDVGVSREGQEAVEGQHVTSGSGNGH